MGSFHRTKSRTISTRERILSFLSESAGTHKEYWSTADLMRWIEMIKVSNVLKRGAKDKIQDVIDNKRGYLFDEREFYREIFEEFALQKALNRDIEWFRSNLLSTKRNAVDYPLTVYQKQGRKALEEKPKITIGTIHSVKGGEAQVVILCPDLSLAAAQEYRKFPDSVIRTFYVGMTRAKESLILCRPYSDLCVEL